ncbi:hypothetical protein AB7459_12910 [Providencia rettgeri]|uniref:hypothetical protein n=1 Tax=Providencia sp. PROV269 TaxID=2949957 RepID=UPI00234B2003|nr:hypothetical protein [Providencia sp. PROV269]ELR5297351.1 hypothetical protein [Providencia rettgeri]
MLINKKNTLYFLPLILVTNTPSIEVNIGVSAVHIYQIFTIFFGLLFLSNIKRFSKLEPLVLIGVLIIILFSILIIFQGRDEELIKYANSNINSEWQILYEKKTFNDFYRDSTISIFQLINFSILFICFHFYYNAKLGIEEYRRGFKFFIIITLVIQFIIIIFQVIILNIDRPSGTFGNAQSLGFMMNIAIAWSLTTNNLKNLTKVSFILCGIAIIILSGTRSSLAICFLIIISYFLFRKNTRSKKVILYALLIITFTFTILISAIPEIRQLFLLSLSQITSPLTMSLRGMMWESFYYVFPEYSILGTKGITVYFTDNFFWFFLLPYGFLGLFFLSFFFKLLIKNSINNDFLFLLSISIIVQSISYYGFFIGNLGWVVMGIIAFEINSKNKVNV